MFNLRIILILFFLLSCSRKNDNISSLEVIDIPKALCSQKDVRLSQFINDTIEYIYLKETDQSILFLPLIEVTKNFIIARNSGFSAMGPILLFDRNTGKFIKGVGKSGRGPGEFQMGNTTFYNIYSKSFYGLSYSENEIVEFDSSGNYLGIINLPVIIDERINPLFGSAIIGLDQYISKDIFVSSISNFTGIDKRRIVVYSRDSVINVFPNYYFWERGNWRYLNTVGLNTNYYRWDNRLFFKEVFNDTIYQLTVDSLIPKFVFKTSGFGPIPELMAEKINFDVLANYYFIKDICENNDYLFFQLHYNGNIYTCVYDKESKSTTICELHEGNKSGFVDDINGFMPISPIKTTQNNEIICKLEAEEIIKWMQDNPEKSANLKSKLPWLKSISTTSNPIIVIAKCK